MQQFCHAMCEIRSRWGYCGPVPQIEDSPPPRPSDVVALRVREHRDLHGMTQGDLARRLRDEFGWSGDRTIVARIESKKRAVTVNDLFDLSAALDTSPVLLLTPLDESEPMAPTVWRTMTSNRVRAWVNDEVRLWEQDKAGFQLSSKTAWAMTLASRKEMERLSDLLVAIYGVERIDDVDPSAELPERKRAEAELVELRIDVAWHRHHWESGIGSWPYTDLGDHLRTLEANPLTAYAKSRELWGHNPTEELIDRRAETESRQIETAEDSRTALVANVDVVRSVVADLASAIAESVRSRSRAATETPSDFKPPA